MRNPFTYTGLLDDTSPFEPILITELASLVPVPIRIVLPLFLGPVPI